MQLHVPEQRSLLFIAPLLRGLLQVVNLNTFVEIQTLRTIRVTTLTFCKYVTHQDVTWPSYVQCDDRRPGN